MLKGNVGDLKVKLTLTDNEVFTSTMTNVSALIQQIEISNFKDENGHDLKNNLAYNNLLDGLGMLEEV